MGHASGVCVLCVMPRVCVLCVMPRVCVLCVMPQVTCSKSASDSICYAYAFIALTLDSCLMTHVA
jgi:hypothetical protein